MSKIDWACAFVWLAVIPLMGVVFYVGIFTILKWMIGG